MKSIAIIILFSAFFLANCTPSGHHNQPWQPKPANKMR
jgi:hypothetical protein